MLAVSATRSEDAHTIGRKGGNARMRKLRGHAAFCSTRPRRWLRRLTPEAFDTMLLIGGDVARQRQVGVEPQMGQRHKGRGLGLRRDLQAAHDPTLVTRVADPRDRAGRRYLGGEVLGLKCRGEFRRHPSCKRQCGLHLGQKGLGLFRIVDHAAAANSTSGGVFQFQGSNVCSSLALVRPATMRSRTSVSHAIGSMPFNFAVWISVIAMAQ